MFSIGKLQNEISIQAKQSERVKQAEYNNPVISDTNPFVRLTNLHDSLPTLPNWSHLVTLALHHMAFPATEIRRRMPNTKDQYSGNHWHTLEHIEHPLVCKRVSEYPQGEFDQAVDGSDL